MSGVIMPFKGVLPQIAADAFIASTAVVIGAVEIGAEASILPASTNFCRMPRLITAQDLRFGLVKPRLGRRM